MRSTRVHSQWAFRIYRLFFFSIVTQNLTEPFTRAGVWSLSHAETDLVILRNIEEDLIFLASDLFFVHESFWGLD